MSPPLLLPILLFTSLSLTTPIQPRGDSSCSQSSLSGLNWIAKSFHYHSLTCLTSPTSLSPATSGSLSFNLSNPALGPSFDQLCTATSPTPDQFFYLDRWFTCLYTSPSGSNLNPLVATTSAASFRFDKSSGRFEVRQSWECGDGADPNYPTAQFSASGGVNVTLDCKVDVWQNPNWGASDLLYANETVECGVQDVQVVVETIEASA